MPDISMCMNKECPSHNACFRYRAQPHPYRQAYMDFKPKQDDKSCDDYIDVTKNFGYALQPAN